MAKPDPRDSIIKELQEKLAALESGQVVSKVETERQALRAIAAENAKIRAALKARTKKTGKGDDEVAHYYSHSAHYRRGVYTPGGNVVQLPIAEDPSIFWKAVGPTGLVLEDDSDEPMERQPNADDSAPEANTMSDMNARRPSDQRVA